jgi:enoyl-CoA hydratase
MAGALAAFTDDAREGIASFKEKRAPRYAGS